MSEGFEERRRRSPREWATRMIFMSLLLAIVALGVFGMLADEVFEGDTLRFDMAVRDAVHAHASPVLTAVMRGFSVVGSGVVVGPATVLLLILFLALALKNPRQPDPELRAAPSKARPQWRRAAGVLAITMAGDVALEVVLKHMFRRPRPAAFFGYGEPPSYSFPSGHAMGAFCLYLVLAGIVAHRVESRAAKAAVWAAAVVMVLAIGASRVYLGVHWPTDIIAGYAAAAMWVGTVVSIDGWRGRRKL